MIRREVNQEVGYSVTDIHGARYVHVVATPRSGSNIADPTRDALRAVAQVMETLDNPGAIVQQSVFVANPDQIDESRQVVERICSRQMPATTYVAQPPCGDASVAVEAFGLVRADKRIRVERWSDQLVVVRHDGVSWCHCGHVPPGRPNGSVHAGALDAFGQMNDLLEAAGFGFAHVVRTWLYLGDIIGQEDDRQRYQELNRARADFFGRVRFRDLPGRPGQGFYPASTGIGADGRGLAMSCIALAGERDDVAVLPLENPLQTSAYDYAPSYSPRSPRFSRAAAVVLGDAATLFVSGTASITESQSRHPDNIELQTNQTLDNIAALISPSNCRTHGIDGFGATLADLAQMRVYLKRESDYETVREICRRRVGDLPIVYTVADICRPELLVEIEAVAYTRRV